MTDKEFEREWKAREKAKQPKVKAKAKPKAKAKKADALAGMGDFLAGVKGKSLGTGGLSDVGRKSNALKKLYGALARRGWNLKGTDMTRGKSLVSPCKGGDFGVMVKHGSKTQRLELGKGCVIEVDTIVGDVTKAVDGRVAAWW